MAHEEAGHPVETAASLFDAGDESTVDFFASSFNEDSSQGQSSSHDSDVASNLFEAGPDESTASFYQSVSHDPLLSNGSGVLNSESHPEAPPSLSDQGQGWQDELGQWHLYDNQSQYTSTYDYASTSQSTDLYAPGTEYLSQTPVQPSEQPTAYAPPQQGVYHSPYTPQQTSHQSYASHSYGHSPAATQNGTYSQYAYNPYVPGIQTRAKPSSTASEAPTQSLQNPKDVKAYRPSTLNAYDPPIPSKVRSKTRSAFHAPQPPPTVPNDAHYQYAGTFTSFSPPPPAAGQGVSLPKPPISYRTTAGQSIGTSEMPHDANSSGWNQENDRNHNAGLSSHHSGHGETSRIVSNDSAGPPTELTTTGSASADYTENSASLQPVSQESNGTLTTSADERNFGENFPMLADASAAPATSFQAPPSQNSFEQPLHDGQLSLASANIDGRGFSPPPLTGSPVDYSHTPQPTTHAGPYKASTDDRPSYDPYAPVDHSRQSSDKSFTGSTYSNARSSSPKAWDAYAPPKPTALPRKNSAASSVHSSHIGGVTDVSQDPYAPMAGLQRVQSRQSERSYDNEYTSRYNYTHELDTESAEPRANSTAELDVLDSLNILTPPTYAPYAPSPSLLGTNDPLGRASARVPVISFGFGGKLVTCFHSAGETASGFDVSLTSRQSTSVQLRTLHEVIPASAMDSSAPSYPGPLFSDPGASSMSLARTVGVGTANNVKTKKTLVLKWLEERSEELSSGIAHIASGSLERYNAEGKLVLIRLLKAMVDNDGQLSGSPSIEWAVRSALVPRLESQGSTASADGLSATEHTSSYAPPNEQSLAVYHLRSSTLDRIQEFLLRGERRQAYHYALDEKLWAHAMLIASSVDTQAWKEAVNEFLRSELAVNLPGRAITGSNSEGTVMQTNGRESLRVAYSLFAGQGAAAVQELIPPRATPAAKDSLLAAPSVLHATPLSPNFPQPALTSSVPTESLAKWQETAAVMAFSQAAGDSAALTALGDYLAANRWFEAAHACYLLSPRTSSLGGVGIPSVRIVLVGCESPSTLRNFNIDLDVTLLSEIVEFALSLSPPKGQDAFGGLPHLQAYKLIRACHLAEMGHVELANRYCEAIGSTIRSSTRGSQFYTPTFIGELKNLSDRLTAAPQMDKAASWITRKVAKPSLDSIGSWLEGRFSKLIVGDGEDGPEPPVVEQAQPSQSEYGAFSHYSTISSATTSASPSPSPTPYARHSTATASGMPFGHAPIHIDRASSAMDHLRPEARRASPVPRVASASATTTSFTQAYNPTSQYRPTLGGMGGVSESEGSNDTEGQDVAWWGSSSQDRSGPTPTAATFQKVDEAGTGGNFVSLMDDFSPSITPMAPGHSQLQSQNVHEEEADEEDLGFGNSSTKKQKADTGVSEEEPKEQAKEAPKPAPSKPELKQQSSSWLGRWWTRNSEPAQSGPVKAKLGEETSFYYDKELKRWVNKKAGATEAAPTPPLPPPSRPRTASPAPGGHPPPKTGDVGAPPHARPASAADMTMPPRKPPRVRSNLVPAGDPVAPGSAPPSATSFENSKSGPAPPLGVGIGRPKSSAAKRNVRSRYVDVFQQQS
ncbi:Sec23-binding domain of Sec16-domain-containing protein [Gautieria morchelliformis]|nr:Sec23-binding domain of Sec16-domain-containing protein [Gautieria morchelliformis]